MLLIEAVLLSLCVDAIVIVPAACQSVMVDIEPCFGISSPTHRTHLRSMYSGAAYALKTQGGDIPLVGQPYNGSAHPHACAFAFAAPTHPQFHFVTVYIKQVHLNITAGVGGEASLVFMGNSHPTVNLATVRLTKMFPVKRDFYVDTQDWPKNSTTIYVFLIHNFIGDRSGEATLHLDLALTPTYLCVMSQFQVRGSHANLRNPYDISLINLNEMFHPGWLICTTPVVANRFGFKLTYRFVAYCVDYRLSCDGVVNCPRGPTTLANKVFATLPQSSADEYSRGLICYAPSVNWFLVAIVLFSIVNIALLFLISYVGLLRRYSPLRYLRLQSQCLRYGCCCLPIRWRQIVVGSPSIFRQHSISSADLDIPRSPPTYASVEQADKANLFARQSNRHFRWGRQKTVTVAKSSHHLPPSYSDVNEEIGVAPEGVIKKMQTLQGSSSSCSGGGGHVSSSPKVKPLPQRLRRPTRRINLRVELRIALRRTVSRTRALLRSGFRIVRFRSTPQPLLNSEAGGEGSSTNPLPPPNYSEFLSGDFPRYPATVIVDHIRPPPSTPTERIPFLGPRRHRPRRRNVYLCSRR
ncbi:unnamed protein product [Hydatigera taeniaeformis]|uniref:CUB domain-containing protein n=1 Tax=Hydatigena taeniaeformis TaxID=6205 RepID=A0A0R3X1B6_HYDTA|nr:unnamed protein product [Hydatigera taeniaeformis]